jgi:hypothetical protein
VMAIDGVASIDSLAFTHPADDVEEPEGLLVCSGTHPVVIRPLPEGE